MDDVMYSEKGALMRLVLFFVMAVLLSSCADNHQLMRMGGNLPKLDQGGVVYVSVPGDGRYGQTIYYGSGQNTAQIVVLAFSQHLKRVESGHEYQDFNASLGVARKIGAMYLVAPTILEWEDRATEWSGIPDKASIKLTVTDVSTGATLDSVILKGKSGLATFGGDHPQDLLPRPVGEYVNSLY
ncbi:DUF4823 domain-containing protein [Sulfuriflexus sp.]|uniref:DUF4823 domain-containing protein n=1 Tax=Sulfuriflexus sp. TaxID=2015443 RepID=UPI0028CCA3D8|nr:DUF4823 domain-containing protein [Sulfuriflexus sp.]MDT8404538.1 DUF4823 domain-containing protein [Sulfuriflexus sp.]